MAQDEHLERRRVAMVDEPLQQLPVGQPARGPGFEEDLDVVQERDGCTPTMPELPVVLDQGLYQ